MPVKSLDEALLPTIGAPTAPRMTDWCADRTGAAAGAEVAPVAQPARSSAPPSAVPISGIELWRTCPRLSFVVEPTTIRRRLGRESSRCALVGCCIVEDERAKEEQGGGPELEALARAASAGNREALEALLELDYSRLHRVCWRVLRDDESALDATQEAVISIARHIRGFDGRSKYSTWSYRIAANAALDEVRRAGRRPIVALVTERQSPELPHSASPEAEVVSKLTIASALDQLPVEQRDALRLRHLLGLEYSEIASILRVPVGTVRSRISRGRVALARLLSEDGEDDDLATGPQRGNALPPSGVEPEVPT
ncbi:MAG: RNA polymerase sigma factor [Acidimicrobiales bacterium]